jgi:hypothetical protein
MSLMSRATHILQWAGQWVAKSRDGANPNKPVLSGDCSLQFDCMNAELVVIGDQQAPVNTFSPLVHTARQLSRVDNTRRSDICADLRWDQRGAVSRNLVATCSRNRADKFGCIGKA